MLGLSIERTEGAKFWVKLFNDLRTSWLCQAGVVRLVRRPPRRLVWIRIRGIQIPGPKIMHHGLLRLDPIP